MNKITSTLLILLAMTSSPMAMDGATGSAASHAAMDIERPAYVEPSLEEKNRLIEELQQLLGDEVQLNRQEIVNEGMLYLREKFGTKTEPEKNDILLKICKMSWLKELNFPFNRLTSLPPEIAKLTQLQTLYLLDNKLTSLPPEIGDLTQLQELILEGNQLTSLPPEIAKLTQLQELYLSSNQLTSVPATLGNIQTLTVLGMMSLPNLLAVGPSPDQWGRQEILRHFGDRVAVLDTSKAIQIMPSTTTEDQVYTALDQQPIRINR